MIKSQPLKWHGGKSYMANWIHSIAPSAYTHRNIVFGGGLGEFWNWLPIDGISEAVNDTNKELTTFYAVLRDRDLFDQFKRAIEFVPFCDDMWTAAVGGNKTFQGIVKGAVQQAYDFFIKYRQSRQGLGKDYATPTTRTRRGMNENVSAWLSAVDGLQDCHERLRRVEIRNLDFAEFIRKYDHEKALFYCDPPYLHETRSSTGEYGPHEMTAEQHHCLLRQLAGIKGKFMLSGYMSELYTTLANTHNWKRHDKETTNNASSSKTKEPRTECVWTNY